VKKVLYIHGMGGGSDSRIPSILNEALSDVEVVCRTYSFDPEEASDQISSWMEEVKPDLVIGESLGCLHALRQRNIPRILISPALNAPVYFEILAWLTLIPGVTWIFDRIYRPREGDRQPLHFTFRTLRKYRRHRKLALLSSSPSSCAAPIHAFIGTRDHYLRSAIVSVKTWKKHFGQTFTLYDGTHFTEEEHIFSLVIPMILKVLNINK
jgi:hypothetical protein